MQTRRRFGTVTLTLFGIAGAGTLWAGAASAHVTVAAPSVSAGASDASITFRVPDESATASTVGLKLQLPTDHPIAGVLVAPITGWTATIKTTKLTVPLKTDDGNITEVVSEIDWTAGTGAGIKPGLFGPFTILAGKLPDGVSALTFKAIQTYSDGSTVSWIDQSAPGSTTAPDHPAPTLQLANAATGQTASGSASASPSPSVSPSVAPTVTAVASGTKAASKRAATTGIVLGALGVALGAAALLLATARRRRNAA